MNFTVRPEIFEKFPQYIVGVVVLKGASNTGLAPDGLLMSACERAAATVGETPKLHPMVRLWRDAFVSTGYNPNKFAPSIDALTSRVARTKSLPSINKAVDLINAVSLTHLLPMGAHDLAMMKGDLEVRAARPGEIFTPMGEGAVEAVDPGEIVYADLLEVRTRRWIWRQGDKAKVTSDTTMLFCPIDGFSDSSMQAVLAARETVAHMLYEHLGGEMSQYLIDRANPTAAIL